MVMCKYNEILLFDIILCNIKFTYDRFFSDYCQSLNVLYVSLNRMRKQGLLIVLFADDARRKTVEGHVRSSP